MCTPTRTGALGDRSPFTRLMSVAHVEEHVAPDDVLALLGHCQAKFDRFSDQELQVQPAVRAS